MGDYYVGIDGGGTKTVAALADRSGTVLATCRGGPSSIVGAPSAEACGLLCSLVPRLCNDAGVKPDAIIRIALGLSGIDFADEFAMQHAALCRALDVPPNALILINDAIVALWGATPSSAAVILQHGTGLTAAYRSSHGREELFDHLDVGRCFDLTAEALALVARMGDGRASVTALRFHVLACLGHPDHRQFAERIYRRQFTPEQQALLQAAVYAAGAEGDATAQELIQRAVDDYACTVDAMVRCTGDPAADVVFGGGRLVTTPEWVWYRLVTAVHRLQPDVNIMRPILPPAVGGAIMAAFADGCPPERFFGKETG